MRLNFRMVSGSFVVARYDPKLFSTSVEFSKLTNGFRDSSFYSITKTKEEISIVCDKETLNKLPTPQKLESEYSMMRIELDNATTLDFSLVGILAKASSILANVKISIFAFSTFDTDYLLLKTEKLELALNSLKENGCVILNQ